MIFARNEFVKRFLARDGGDMTIKILLVMALIGAIAAGSRLGDRQERAKPEQA